MKTYSLTTRILAHVIGVGVAALALHTLLLLGWMRPISNDVVVQMDATVASVAARLEATPPERRDELAAALGKEGIAVSRAIATEACPAGIEMPHGLPASATASIRCGTVSLPGSSGAGVVFGTGVSAPMPHAPLAPSASAVEVAVGGAPFPLPASLRTFGGSAVGLVGSDGETAVQVALPIGNESWQIGFTAPRPRWIWTLLPMIGTVALVVIAAAAAMWLGVRAMITAPMSRLAGEMLARRQSLQPIEEPARSSLELLQVVRSFNTLVHAMQRNEQSRRSMLAGMSHDLRTPLARLQLRAEIECPEQAYALMERDFAVLTHIIDQFLAYSQGQVEAPADGLKPVGAVVRQVVSQYAASGHDVRALRGADIGALLPDIVLRRALTNLIDNALAYGKPPVEVELREANDDLELVVFDQGPGIAPDQLELALTPFVRLGGTHHSADGHCGLGLAIVAQIASHLKGRIIHIPFDGNRFGVGLRVAIGAHRKAPPISRS